MGTATAAASRQSAAIAWSDLGNKITSDVCDTERRTRKFTGPLVEPLRVACLKDLHANDEILLGVLADGLHQLLRLVQRLVGVVVEGAVLHQLPQCPLALV